jgi:hypothetical protein
MIIAAHGLKNIELMLQPQASTLELSILPMPKTVGRLSTLISPKDWSAPMRLSDSDSWVAGEMARTVGMVRSGYG